jgi:DNA polymerase III subunit delta'
MQETSQFDWPIIGHGGIKRFLQTSLMSKSLGGAYIFYGPEKVGKSTTARAFAKSVLCEKYAEYESLSSALDSSQLKSKLPCGECENCIQFAKGLYADFYVLEREVNEKTGEKKASITVNQIRELQEKLNKRSFHNSYKIVIIKEAETLNQEASNSLLKTLEEPTPKTILILVATTRDSLLPTIQSRAQMFKFLPITRDQIYEYLTQKGIDRETAKELASLSVGRPTVAMRFSESGDELALYKKEIEQMLDMFDGTVVERFKFVDQFSKKQSNDELIAYLSEMSCVLRDALMAKLETYEMLNHVYLEMRLKAFAAKFTTEQLIKLLQKVEQTKIYIKQNINSKLALENLIINN